MSTSFLVNFCPLLFIILRKYKSTFPYVDRSTACLGKLLPYPYSLTPFPHVELPALTSEASACECQLTLLEKFESTGGFKPAFHVSTCLSSPVRFWRPPNIRGLPKGQTEEVQNSPPDCSYRLSKEGNGVLISWPQDSLINIEPWKS